jgi:hypothetical protein
MGFEYFYRFLGCDTNQKRNQLFIGINDSTYNLSAAENGKPAQVFCTNYKGFAETVTADAVLAALVDTAWVACPIIGTPALSRSSPTPS